jgi:PilZ domain
METLETLSGPARRLVDGPVEDLKSMEQQLYCVYNQTSECFLSLGVTHHSSALTRMKGILAGRAQRYDEGNWVDRPKARDLFRSSSRDLVFLDDKHRVVGAIESFAPFRFAPIGPNVESVLALPERTIYSSQTQPGNQLVICVAEEMEFRLRSMPDLQKYELCDFPLDAESLQVPNPQSFSQDRRISRRKRWPRLVAYDSTGGALEVHGVKDLSAHGLYLMTKDRWPLGTHVTMTLQRTDGVDDSGKHNTISVQLRVVRWGKDGVGLAFMQSDAEVAPLMALTAR